MDHHRFNRCVVDSFEYQSLQYLGWSRIQLRQYFLHHYIQCSCPYPNLIIYHSNSDFLGRNIADRTDWSRFLVEIFKKVTNIADNISWVVRYVTWWSWKFDSTTVWPTSSLGIHSPWTMDPEKLLFRVPPYSMVRAYTVWYMQHIICLFLAMNPLSLRWIFCINDIIAIFEDPVYNIHCQITSRDC